MKSTYPTAAATKPGSRLGINAAPRPTAPSIIMKLATSGPPNNAEIAANEPAVVSSLDSRGPSRARPATTPPTAEPRATSGASGPSTAPNARVANAARAMPGTLRSGVGAMLSPSVGRWPPSPGRSVGPPGRPPRPRPAAPTPGTTAARWPQARGQLIPEPVLGRVDQRNEDRCDRGCRQPDRRAEH